MIRKTALAACVVALGACSSAPPEAAEATTSEELISCGWLSGGDCTALPAGNWRTPEFWGELYLHKYSAQLRSALDHIEPGPAPIAQPRTVLLVTGVTIKAAWMEPIAARLRRDGFKTVIYEPPHLLSYDLFQASHDLGAVVERVKRESGESKIDILAECTGGLISRHYIQTLGGDANVSRLVTFVSPQHGLPVAPIVNLAVGWPALRDLSPGSAFLHAVNDAPMSSVPVTSIYTCTDEYIEPYRTSIIPGATNIGLCGHGFVGHFQTMYDPAIYPIMHDALVKPIPPQ